MSHQPHILVRPQLGIALVSALVLVSSLVAEIPPYVVALEGTTAAVSSPALDPEGWLLAHIDVETTGLVPGYHEMIDIGVIITDLDGDELERLFLRIMPAHPERTAPGAAAVNGFSVALWKERGYVDPATAVEQLVAFHQRVAVERNLLFTAYNAWFDISFVDHLFRGEGKTWRELFHYFVLDLPSMAWSMGLRNLSGPELNQILQIESETDDPLEHTGLTGAESNVAFYRALLRVGENGAMGNTAGKPF